MKPKHLLMLASALLLAAGTAALAQEDMLTLWREIINQSRDGTPPAERLKLLHEFLEQYPDSDRASAVANLTTEIYIHQLDRPAEGIALLKRLRADAKAGRQRAEFTTNLIQAYGGMRDLDGLRRFVDEITKAGEVDPFIHSSIGNAAFNAGEFAFAAEHFDQAYQGATEDWYNSKFPQMDEDRRAEHRSWFLGRTLSNRGKAYVQLKRYDDAEKAFAGAWEVSRKNIVGVSSNDNRFLWATALAEQGKIDAAMEKLLVTAFMQRDAKAVELLETFFREKFGAEADFAAYAEEKSLELAVPAPDFTLKDYAGNTVTLSSYKGSVVMLNFWFPT